jgi:hypothetical protein
MKKQIFVLVLVVATLWSGIARAASTWEDAENIAATMIDLVLDGMPGEHIGAVFSSYGTHDHGFSRLKLTLI